MSQRKILPLNMDWEFCPEDDAELTSARAVCLPHTNTLLPANYFTEKRTQFVSWYRKRLDVPESLRDRRIFVDFDGVMMAAEVYLNGQKLREHRGGYVPFSVDLTEDLKWDGSDVLTVRVDSRLLEDVPPCGHVMDYLPFGGIYREVHLRAVPTCHIADIFVRTPEPLEARKTVEVDITLANFGDAADCELTLDLPGTTGGSVSLTCRCPSQSECATHTLRLDGLTGLDLWETEHPTLYEARVTLKRGGDALDEVTERFGFREAEFTSEGPFLLNGRPLKLIGHNRHQTYAYIGAAAPARLQRKDADMLKFEQGANIVRTSHYPQSPHFLDRCDEIGLLVFEEVPGWGHIGGPKWQEHLCRDVEAMIRRDRNHPSIILWGVRVNESSDNHDLYARTNEIARREDPTRQTGGVRWGLGSEFLEDVYTTNDYAYGRDGKIINEPEVMPYLITEYVGCHTEARPTDSGQKLVRHAMVHAEIVNAVMGHPKIAGAIGWCAFDYASQDWITVDGVQPWGIADLFRHPKWAAWFYESQIDPQTRPVLRIASRWRVGDLAGFDPNQALMKSGHDAPLVVFSNCDRIDVHVGREKKGSFEPARDAFPHLAHPPFLCTDTGRFWGPSWQDLRVTGYLDDRKVAEQVIPATNETRELRMEIDDDELVADGSDMARILLKHTDTHGNVQSYSRASAVLTVEGPADLIGPNPAALAGGVTGLFLRAGRQAGAVTVRAEAEGLGRAETEVAVREV